MTRQEQLQGKRDEILRLAEHHGARNVRVFGSVARGEATEDSDVDFLVDLAPGRSLLDLGGLLMDLRELLGCRVDVVTEKGLKDRIRPACFTRPDRYERRPRAAARCHVSARAGW